MVDDVINILFAVAIGSGFISFLLRWCLYLYLEITNYRFKYFSYSFQIGFLLNYDKLVQPKQQSLKKIMNLLLLVIKYSFITFICLCVVKAL